ncbi:MAG: NifB/NifX family molybdenum-iron cluster-binding protein [Desulfobulbaceae bacterium]|nr:NifB/NifX family molybdenum-iron cluster-binding protein [Desulfobulbaceae bacterium]
MEKLSKILITIQGNFVAPRFDMVSEVLIASTDGQKLIDKPRTILISRPSADELCSFITKEDISIVVCGGIEERHHKYLSWTKKKIFDSVIGPYEEALQLVLENRLVSGTILPGAVGDGACP